MPSVSARQQRYFGAIKGGAIAQPKGMSDRVVDEFASTPRKGLPEKAPVKHMADGGHWMERAKHLADGTAGHWAANAFAGNKGGLHRATHTPEGQKIPAYRVRAAAHSGNPHVRHMAQAAINI